MATRRQVLRAASGAMTIVLGGLQMACTPEDAAQIESAGLADGRILALVRMVQLLFPHQHLDPAVYRNAVIRLGDEPSVQQGIVALGSEWLDLSADEQIARLRQIEDTLFFKTVRAATLPGIYGDERTWKMLGYGGDASRFGGYIDRGFNDIDWLPEVDTD